MELNDPEDPGLASATRLPTMSSGRVTLRHVDVTDYGFIRNLELNSPFSPLYRHRGASIAPESWGQLFWTGALVHSLAVATETGERLGVLTCYNADFRHGYAYLATVLTPEARGRGWPLESSALFIGYLFTIFPFRKLYAQSLEFAESAGPFAASQLRVEGCLKDHEWHDGRYWDLTTYALYRNEWQAAAGNRRDRVATFRDAMHPTDGDGV